MHVCDLSQPQAVTDLYRRTVAQGESISVARLEVRKGSTTQPHTHRHEEMVVLLQGSWVFRFPQGEVTLRPNQVLTIAPGTEHSSEVLEDVVAIDICSPTREDWVNGEDRPLHTDPDLFLWAV